MIGGIELFKGVRATTASGLGIGSRRTSVRIAIAGGNVHFTTDPWLHRDREGEAHLESTGIGIDAQLPVTIPRIHTHGSELVVTLCIHVKNFLLIGKS